MVSMEIHRHLLRTTQQIQRVFIRKKNFLLIETNLSSIYFRSIPRDYSQTGTSWSTATTGNNNYKPVSTTTTTTSSVSNYPPHQATSAYQWTGQPPYLISTYPYAAPV